MVVLEKRRVPYKVCNVIRDIYDRAVTSVWTIKVSQASFPSQ